MANKLLLGAIALGLWANASATFVGKARADNADIILYLSDIARDVHALAYGGRNYKNLRLSALS